MRWPEQSINNTFVKNALKKEGHKTDPHIAKYDKQPV